MGVFQRYLKDFAASWDMCKRIPKGAFSESALVYPYAADGTAVWKRDSIITQRLMKWGYNFIPAPTLEEVMERFPNHVFYIVRKREKWIVEAIHEFRLYPTARAESAVSAADAALQIFLKLKGIK